MEPILPNKSTTEWTRAQSRLVASLALILLLIVVVFAYRPALMGPFVLDDSTNIPQTHIDDLSLESVLEVAFDNNSGIFGRPIPVATFALNHFFGDSTPYAFKLTNLVIHVLNTILVFVLARFLIGIFATAKVGSSRISSTILAVMVSAIWCLHPLQVSTVMYSVQRMTMIMTMFTFLSIICYLSARITYIDRPGKSLGLLILTGILAILACLSKENGALIVFYIGGLELVIRQHRIPPKHLKHEYNFSNFVIISASTTILAAVAYYYYKIEDLLVGYQIRDFTLTERLATEANIITMYLRNIIAPDISNMNLYWDDFPLSQFNSSETIFSLVIIVSLLSASVVLRRISLLIPIGTMFFFLSHIMESTFIPLELAFEHRNYTGIAGLALVVVVGFVHLLEKLNLSRLNYLIATAMLLMLSFQTYSRSLEWSDDLILNTMAVENNPHSDRAKLSLAISLLDRSRLTEAVHLFEKAAMQDTRDASTHLHLLQFKAYGGVYSEHDLTTALDLLETRPVTNEVVNILSDMLMNVTNGIYSSPSMEIISALLMKAVSNPNLMIVETNQAVLQTRYSESLLSLGDLEGALEALEAASSLNPRNPEISIKKAELLVRLHRFGSAKTTTAAIPTDIRVTDEQKTRLELIHDAVSKHVNSELEITQSAD